MLVAIAFFLALNMLWCAGTMYETRKLGLLQLQLFAPMKSQIAFSDFCLPAGTIDFTAADGFLRNDLLLFSLTFPGYELEARVRDGAVFFRRNGQYQHSESYTDNGKYHVAIQWDAGSIGCGVAPWTGDAGGMNPHMRAVHTEPTVPPSELVRVLRTQNLLFNSAYRCPDDLFVTVLDCFHLCELDIRRLGAERFCWGKNGDSHRPLHEPEISRFVATFLASHGATRNFDVTCNPIAGSGNVDFWVVGPVVSAGLARVAIEAKKAENPKLERSFTKQLPEYMARLGTTYGIFLTYWMKSTNYRHPTFESYADLEAKVLHPRERGPGVRTVGINLSNGPSPSRI